MKTLVLLLGVFLGALFGFGVTAAYYKTQVLPAGADGMLKYYVSPPGGSGFPPTGYYVESRVYLDHIDPSLVGKTIWVQGNLDRISGPDGIPVYPLLHVTEVSARQSVDTTEHVPQAGGASPHR